MLARRRSSGARWFALAGPLAAILLAIGPAHAQGAGVTLATDVQKAEAGESYQRGTEAFAAGELDKALEEFQRSLAVVNSPNSRLMLARTLARLGRPAQAYAELEQTLIDADRAAQIDDKYSATADAARAELTELRPQVGLVNLRVSGSTSNDSLSVGEKEIEQTHWDRPVAVAPGKVRLVFRTASGEVVREVDVAGGGETTVELSPPAPAQPPPQTRPVSADSGASSTRTLGFVAGGIGIAGLTAFAIFGQLNNAEYQKLRDACTDNECPRHLESVRDKGETYQTIANVGLAVGALGIGTGVILLLNSDDGDPGEASLRRRHARATARGPRVGIGPGYVDVSGSF